MKLDYRFSGLGPQLKVMAVGNRLGDVQRMGVRLIVDWKGRRFCYQGIYPIARPMWTMRLPERKDVSFLLAANAR